MTLFLLNFEAVVFCIITPQFIQIKWHITSKKWWALSQTHLSPMKNAKIVELTSSKFLFFFSVTWFSLLVNLTFSRVLGHDLWSHPHVVCSDIKLVNRFLSSRGRKCSQICTYSVSVTGSTHEKTKNLHTGCLYSVRLSARVLIAFVTLFAAWRSLRTRPVFVQIPFDNGCDCLPYTTCFSMKVSMFGNIFQCVCFRRIFSVFYAGLKYLCFGCIFRADTKLVPVLCGSLCASDRDGKLIEKSSFILALLGLELFLVVWKMSPLLKDILLVL